MKPVTPGDVPQMGGPTPASVQHLDKSVPDVQALSHTERRHHTFATSDQSPHCQTQHHVFRFHLQGSKRKWTSARSSGGSKLLPLRLGRVLMISRKKRDLQETPP